MSEQIFVPKDAPISVVVTVHNDQAVLHFSEPRPFVAFSQAEPLMIGQRLIIAGVEANPELAEAGIATAMGIIDGIYDLRGEIKPAGGAVKHELIERHRKTLTKRFEVICNSKREHKKLSNQQLAQMLVDVALHDIFA